MTPNLKLINKILFVIVLVIVIYIAVQTFVNPLGVYQNVNTALLIVAVSVAVIRLLLRHKINNTEKVEAFT